MSLNMYLDETETQNYSMNRVCIEIIQSMEEAKSSITSFTQAMTLQGQTYRSAKLFMSQTYLPLAQGIIYLCEELIRQNDKYPNDFRAQVATTDVVEQEILGQIDELDQMIANLQDLNQTFPLFGITISIYQNMKRRLQEKLNKLYSFNSVSSSNYDTAMQLANSVMDGLRQLQGGKGFNSNTGTFSTNGMDLSWIAKLDKIHYTRKAEEKFADYLREYPEDKEKIITILKYEDIHPQYVKQTDEFLSVLEEKDRTEIKYLMYTADEPYRTLSLRYLNNIEIVNINGDSAFFRHSENSITFNVADDRINERGAYFTFFHELGHAIDYNHGKDNRADGEFYSDVFETDGTTLAGHMHNDVENRIRLELQNELSESSYTNIGSRMKEDMINNITEVFVYKGPQDIELTDDEEDLYEIIQTNISRDLYPVEHNNASDVYGGVTVNEIIGNWGHHDVGYWMNESTGERINEPNKEGFASYYGSNMIEESQLRDEQLASVEEFLPNSKQHMDEMFRSMNEGVN